VRTLMMAQFMMKKPKPPERRPWTIDAPEWLTPPAGATHVNIPAGPTGITYAVPLAGKAPREAPIQRPGGLLSAREAAAFLGVSLTTFKETVQPALPVTRISKRRILFDQRDLEQWRREHTAGGNSDSPKVAPSISFGSGTPVSESTEARASQIQARLRSKRRASTRT